MTNDQIVKIEYEVIRLRALLIDTKIQLEADGRTNENYDFLGTLDVNCKVLKKQLERFIRFLDY